MKFLFCIILAICVIVYHAQGQSTVAHNSKTCDQIDLYVLQEELILLKRQLADNREDLASVKQELSATKQNLTSTIKELASAKENINQLKHFSEAIQSQNPLVAFSAYLLNGPKEPGNAETIPFSGVETNIGGHYNKETSRFTCPIHGVYWFSINLYSFNIVGGGKYDEIYADLIIDGQGIARVYTEINTSDITIDIMASNSVLVQCNANSEVWVMSRSNQMKIYASRRTTFSGFMLANLALP